MKLKVDLITYLRSWRVQNGLQRKNGRKRSTRKLLPHNRPRDKSSLDYYKKGEMNINGWLQEILRR